MIVHRRDRILRSIAIYSSPVRLWRIAVISEASEQATNSAADPKLWNKINCYFFSFAESVTHILFVKELIKMANNILFAILWVLLLWFIAWPVAMICAGLWILLQVRSRPKYIACIFRKGPELTSFPHSLSALWSFVSLPQKRPRFPWEVGYVASWCWTGHCQLLYVIPSPLLKRHETLESSIGWSVEVRSFQIIFCAGNLTKKRPRSKAAKNELRIWS